MSDDRLGGPQTNREMFVLLERSGWLSASLSTRMQAMAGFRDLVVHGYAKVDPDVLKDIVLHRLGDLLDFTTSVLRRMSAGSQDSGSP